MSRKHYLMQSLSDEIADIDPAWLSEATKSGLICSKCSGLCRNVRFFDVEIDEESKLKKPITFLPQIGVTVLRCDLVDALGSSKRDVYRRAISVRGSGRCRSFVGAFGKSIVMVRGGDGSSYRVCPKCKQRIYNPLGSEYVVDSKEYADSSLVQDQLGRLIVSEELVGAIKRKRFRDVQFTPLGVRKDPSDGYPRKLLQYVGE